MVYLSASISTDMKSIFFTPGPSQLYFTVEEHLKKALKENIGSISHRSSQFKDIYKAADNGLRALLGIPDNFSIVFTSSATEIWERTIQGCVIENSLHFVNGAFSSKFHQTAELLGIKANHIKADPGQCASIRDYKGIEPELIAFTHNETSTGASHPLEDIYLAREVYPNALITVDAVSSLPIVDIDYSKIDSIYFSVQKCFGLPAGLGVWIVNDRFMEAALKKESLRKITGGTLRFSVIYKAALEFQTSATPNVLNVFLLAKVVEDMNLKGIDMIRREAIYKAAVLYNMIEEIEALSPFVTDTKLQSKTCIVANYSDPENIIQKLSNKGLIIGNGHGKYSKEHLRIANFPTHSKEQIELLADTLTGALG